MLNRLCWSGIKTACELMQRFGTRNGDSQDVFGESNRPRQREELYNFMSSSDEIFQIAAEHLSDEEILSLIQKWIKDDKASFLVNTVENRITSYNVCYTKLLRTLPSVTARWATTSMAPISPAS